MALDKSRQQDLLSVPYSMLIYDEEEEYEDAIEFLSGVIVGDSSHWIAYHNRGVANSEIGRKTEAITDLMRALALMPTSTKTLEQRADVYVRLGKAKEAMDDFAIAIDLEPDNLSLLLSRSFAWARLGDARKAIEDLTTVIDIDPSNRHRILERAKLYWSLKMWTEGNADFEVYKDMCRKAREAGEIP